MFFSTRYRHLQQRTMPRIVAQFATRAMAPARLAQTSGNARQPDNMNRHQERE